MKRNIGNIKKMAAALAVAALMARACFFAEAVGLEGSGFEPDIISETQSAPETVRTSNTEPIAEETGDTNSGTNDNPEKIAEAHVYAENAEGLREPDMYTESAEGLREPDVYAESTEGLRESDMYAQSAEGLREPDVYAQSTESASEPDIYMEGTERMPQPGGMAELFAENGAVKIVVKRRNGSNFPSGYKIWLLSAEDAAEDNQEEADKIKTALRKDWEEVIAGNITSFLPYFIEITDEQGSAVKEDIRAAFYIEGKEFADNAANSKNICYLGSHKAGSPLHVLEDTGITLESASGPVKITGNISDNGWVSIVQAEEAGAQTDEFTGANAAGISGTEADSGEADSGETNPGETEPGETNLSETGPGETEPRETNLSETDTGEAEPGETNLSETDPGETEAEEMETEETEMGETEHRQETADNIVGLFAAARSMPLGTKLPTGSYSAVTSGMKASAKYNGILFRKGISGMEIFGTASEKLVKGDMGSALYWQPKDGNQKNICGAVYKKVLYNNENHQWYDVKITLNSYTDSVTASDGKKYTCYPYVGFYKERFAFSFYRAGLYVVKCEIINSSTQKKETVKFRLNITDIDDYQVCGFKLGNGTIDKRYCMADSVVNLNMNASIAGISGFEQLTGSDGTIDGTDHRGDVIFDANSSEFYLGIGYGDNDKKSWSRVIEPRYAQAVAGTLSGGFGYLGLLAKSTILPIEIPKPVKQVSNDGSGWSDANTLPSVAGTCWYRVEQFVPQETADNYYSKFLFTDRLPDGVDYVGNISVIRAEDGKNVSGWFDLSAAADVVTASARAEILTTDAFYGYHYVLRFKVKMNISEIQPSFAGNTAVYKVKNISSVTAKHKTDSGDTTQDSSATTTTASAERPETAEPVKRLDGSRTASTKVLSSQDETITFTVWQTFPPCIEHLRPNGMILTDVLKDCLDYMGFEAYSTTDFVSYTNITKTFTAVVKEQTLTVKSASSFAPDSVTIRFDIKCKIKKGYDLSVYEKKLEDGRWYVITNSANVKVSYGYGKPAEVEKNTNDVTVKLEAPVPEGTLNLIKEIDTEDIVFAHGNPVFVFKAEGTDIKGKEHTYFQAVEFTPESADDGGKMRLRAVMKVKAGKYIVTEERTMRYALAEIHSAVNGTISGSQVVFDVSDGETGSAVFYNKKTTDADQSHTALVKNHFGK